MIDERNNKPVVAFVFFAISGKLKIVLVVHVVKIHYEGQRAFNLNISASLSILVGLSRKGGSNVCSRLCLAISTTSTSAVVAA